MNDVKAPTSFSLVENEFMRCEGLLNAAKHIALSEAEHNPGVSDGMVAVIQTILDLIQEIEQKLSH